VTECGDINLEKFKVFDEDKSESVDGFRYTVWEISLALADILSDLHNSGLAYQNLYPSNVVMIKGVPRFIIINLNVAFEESQHNYLPPEFYKNQPYIPLGVYCLGTLMWQLVTGTALYGKALKQPDALREEFPPVMPEKFRRIIEDCWKLEPLGRPSTSQVWDRLKDCQDEMHISKLSAETQMFIKKWREIDIKAKLTDAMNEMMVIPDKAKDNLEARHEVDKAEVDIEDEEFVIVNLPEDR